MPLRLGNCLFDASARTLTRNGATVAVTPKAFTLLEALVEAHPSAVSKEALYGRLWPDVVVEPGNLHNLVSELRAVLGAEAIRTVQRFGYALAQPSAVTRFRLAGAVDIPLPDGETIVGRDLTGSPDVSRRHARFLVGDTITVEDLGSKNGTFVRGARIDGAVVLHEGDEVLFGRARFVLCAAGGTTVTVNENRG